MAIFLPEVLPTLITVFVIREIFTVIIQEDLSAGWCVHADAFHIRNLQIRETVLLRNQFPFVKHGPLRIKNHAVQIENTGGNVVRQFVHPAISFRASIYSSIPLQTQIGKDENPVRVHSRKCLKKRAAFSDGGKEDSLDNSL
jgi:hypothetical protein